MLISGVISRVTIIITHIRGLITPLITTHEPSSKGFGFRVLSGYLVRFLYPSAPSRTTREGHPQIHESMKS